MKKPHLFIILAATCLWAACNRQASQAGYIMTVRGKIKPAEMGRSLIHEHVTTDFAGAEKVVQPQYAEADAVETILPHIRKLKSKGINTLVECTPNYIGRDVKLLKRLSEAGALNIITNTGYYAAVDKKYLPRHAFEENAESLANRWEKEWTEGIEGSGIKPGFIKLGVGAGPLDDIEEKLLKAAVLVSKKTGLPVAIHTGDGEAARSEYDFILKEGLDPGRMIWVHAQNGRDEERIALAKAGVWISLDGVSETRMPEYLKMLKTMKENKLLSRVLISHDDGWSVENKDGNVRLIPFENGNTRPYSTILDQFVPELLRIGFTRKELDRLLVKNPRRALVIKSQ